MDIQQRIAEAMWRNERCSGFEWSSDEAPPRYHRLAAIAVEELDRQPTD